MGLLDAPIILVALPSIKAISISYFSLIPNLYNKSEEMITDIEREKDKKLLVTSGRLVAIKGYESLLEVCNRLNNDKLDYELWILGEGWDRPKLEELIIFYLFPFLYPLSFLQIY